MKSKNTRSIFKSICLSMALGICIIVFGGFFVGIGIKAWSDYENYSFISGMVNAVNENYPEIGELVMVCLINRDSLRIKVGQKILHEKGYSEQVFKQGLIGQTTAVGIIVLILLAMIVVVLLFRKCTWFINKNHIFNLQVLIGIGIVCIVIITSGITIGEVLSDRISYRRYWVVGEIAGTLAHNDEQSQTAEKFVRATMELKHTNHEDELLIKYGYDYEDFKYDQQLITIILSGMMAVAPLALYFEILCFYIQRRTYVNKAEKKSI